MKKFIALMLACALCVCAIPAFASNLASTIPAEELGYDQTAFTDMYTYIISATKGITVTWSDAAEVANGYLYVLGTAEGLTDIAVIASPEGNVSFLATSATIGLSDGTANTVGNSLGQTAAMMVVTCMAVAADGIENIDQTALADIQKQMVEIVSNLNALDTDAVKAAPDGLVYSGPVGEHYLTMHVMVGSDSTSLTITLAYAAEEVTL